MGVIGVPLVTRAYRAIFDSALRRIVYSLVYFVEALIARIRDCISKPDDVVLLSLSDIVAPSCFHYSHAAHVLAYDCDRKVYWVFPG